MNSRHGQAHPFFETAHPGFGVLVQPLVYVQLRVGPSQEWTLPIAALVDTGASITLIQEQYLRYLPGLDADALGPALRFASATSTAACRLAHLDLRIGRRHDREGPLLPQRPIYFTGASLPAPMLLGQRGVLDSLQLIHTNCGSQPSFRLNLP
ncbi:hypothetical protein [Nannocystis radixulma]|uniref:Peptidase A2 domain-containing protein n=1 Tax=Nannocystis radixulma TaxID=2995305 RepID=A0ABT5BAM6_9BACT|nr:hypothetical protein [Nannocystis radixulma]MDC0670087.1 hypothetical protein [Nannocystis radixulma]